VLAGRYCISRTVDKPDEVPAGCHCLALESYTITWPTTCIMSLSSMLLNFHVKEIEASEMLIVKAFRARDLNMQMRYGYNNLPFVGERRIKCSPTAEIGSF